MRAAILASIAVAAAAILIFHRAQQPSVAILGDSIVQQMTPWQPLLPRPINDAVNLGISGDGAVQIAARASSALEYSDVLIEGGVDDLIRGDPAGIVPAYEQILRILRGAKQVRIIGISRVDPIALGPDYRFLNNAAIDAINNQLIDLCATFDNCRPVIAAMRQDVTGLTKDGIHKTAAGYAAWAPLLAGAL